MALAAAALAGGWLWLRDSSLVAVQQVRIAGVRGGQARAIEQALAAAARRMTTMDFDAGALRAAVASFPLVKEVRASTSFPHAVRIEAIERPPVAMLVASGERTAVAADGTVLGEALLAGGLPVVNVPSVPLAGQRLGEEGALAAVTVLGAAPGALARQVARVYEGQEGLTAAMRNGLLVYFGDGSRPHAKWLALAAVLADPGAAGARYVDVRVPERPAAGREGASAAPLKAAAGQAPGSEAAATALAERLAATVGAGPAGAGPAAANGGEEMSKG
jgi:cell division protein FtsQ